MHHRQHQERTQHGDEVRAVLRYLVTAIGRPTNFKCGRVVVPEGVREGTQGYQLRLETAPVLLCRFFIIGVEP